MTVARNNTGGFAFPGSQATEYHDQQGYIDQPGMTLRDYFAAQALAGLCANQALMEKLGVDADCEIPGLALKFADQLILERKLQADKD